MRPYLEQQSICSKHDWIYRWIGKRCDGFRTSGATVTLTNVSTADRRVVTTTDSGDYQFLNLPPGHYSLSVAMQGFKTYTHNDVEVQVELATRQNVTMELGAATEQATVTSAAPIIQSENASLGQVVQGKAVSDIPLNGRNVLAPGGIDSRSSATRKFFS